MPDRLNRYIDPVKTRWNNLSRPQQYKLVGVILAVILAIVLAAFFIFRTNWVSLAGRQDAMTIIPMRQALAAEGIRYRISSDMSTIFVGERDVHDAITAITLREAAPPGDHFSWDMAFDTGLGTTENERHHRARLATEGQIEMQLTSVSGVNTARVILNTPNPRPFDRNAPPPSAAVALNTSRDILPHEGHTLAEIVSRAVIGLEMENITIMDQNARMIFSGDQDTSLDPVSTAQDMRNRHRNQIEMDTRRMFALMYDEVVLVPNFAFDDNLLTEEIIEIFSAPDGFDGGIPFESEVRRAEMEGPGGGFAPGLDWNFPAVPGYAMGGTGNISASQRDTFTNYHVNRHQTISQSGPGWVDAANSSAALTATRWRYVFQDHWMAEDETRTAQEWDVFVNENRLPVNITSQYEGFDYSFGLLMAATNLPAENLSLVIMELMVFVPSEETPLNIPLIVMLAVLVLLLLMLAYGLLQKQKQDNEEGEDAEPELSVEDLLVSTQLEEAKEEAAEELDAIEYFKENEIKKHIEKFVNEKPEAVASLLRNWINIEEW